MTGKDTYRAELAAVVRKKREARGWSQHQLAERWDRSRYSVLRLEKGEVDTDLDTIHELAEVFGESPAEFIWPLFSAEPLEDVETRARNAAMRKFWADLEASQEPALKRWLTALDSVAFDRIFTAASWVAAEGTEDEIRIALNVLSGLMHAVRQRRMAEDKNLAFPIAELAKVDLGVRWPPEWPADWPAQVVEKIREEIEAGLRARLGREDWC
jgi:transcriptional regulator with XRE-family HTH domain